ncbi:MAG: atsA 3 [Planctomycetaceae bacterium]|nr:atsA 3 [Planctomycetaceae bacterium]
MASDLVGHPTETPNRMKSVLRTTLIKTGKMITTMRQCVTSLVFAVLLTGGAVAAAEATQKPNVVVIFIDDLGYADIGPFGATKQKTPHLDRMAREGMKLTSFYAAPVCSVSRAQLLTGCYGARISVPGVYFPGSKNGLNPNEVTIAERLREHGYATMCVGKWHVGDQPEFLPTRQGFDRYFGIPYSNDMQQTSTVTGKKVVPLLRDDKVFELLTDEQQSRIVERYTDEAVGFIRTHKDKPFFLYLPHTAVHTPIWPGEKFRGKSANGRFGDWVEEVDWSVGRVLDTLRELKLDQNTLVVFTSDNGPWLVKGADGGSALPLRGGKGSTWEGGVRVPTIAWWPSKIAPGSVCDAVAGTIDLLPTAVSIAGGKVPAEPVIDGRDISTLLFGKSTTSSRETHYYFAGYNLQAVRQGPWKLAIATQAESMGKGTNADAAQNPRLYNLDQEIGEQTNLAAKYPEIVVKLKELAAKMTAEIGGSSATARRPAGEVANPQTLYPTEAGKPDAKTATNVVKKPANLRELKSGDTVSGESAPQVAGKAFTITCNITTDARDGIILAHGGTAVGYALHLRDGKLVFTTSDKGQQYHVETAFPSSDEPRRIMASLSKDGVLSLQLDKQPAVTTKSPGALSRQPKENFCVGRDDGMPLTKYSTTSTWKGQITELKVEIP